MNTRKECCGGGEWSGGGGKTLFSVKLPQEVGASQFQKRALRIIRSDDVCFQGCQMAKFDPFLSLDCARVEGVGAQSKERKGSNFAA